MCAERETLKVSDLPVSADFFGRVVQLFLRYSKWCRRRNGGSVGIIEELNAVKLRGHPENQVLVRHLLSLFPFLFLFWGVLGCCYFGD